MKEIVGRLHENRQIELAKSILEAAGYTVTRGSTDEWKYYETPKNHRGPFEYPHYYKEYTEDLTGYVYPPYQSKNPQIDSFDKYQAELYSLANDLIGGTKEFNDMESAKQYLDDLASKQMNPKGSKLEVVFKDPYRTYINFKKAAEGFSGDVMLDNPVKYGHISYRSTDDVIGEMFDQAGDVYSFKTVEDVIAALDRVCRGWDGPIDDDEDEDFLRLYSSALEKMDYVLGTNFSDKYGV